MDPTAGRMGSARRMARARLLSRVNNRAPSGELGADLPAGVSAVGMVARNRGASSSAPPRTDVVTQRVSQRPFPAGKNVKSRQAWKYPVNLSCPAT